MTSSTSHVSAQPGEHMSNGVIRVKSYGSTLAECEEIARKILVCIGHARWKVGRMFVPRCMSRLLEEAYDTGSIPPVSVSESLIWLQEHELLRVKHRPEFPIYTLLQPGYEVARLAWLKAEGDEDGFGQYLPLAARTQAPLQPTVAMVVKTVARGPFDTIAPVDGRPHTWGANPC